MNIQLSKRRAFTLVEMLVVIFIIGLLAALLLSALSGAIRSAHNASMALEIAELRQAIEAYRQEKGDYPPCFGIKESYSSTNRENTIVARHLTRCYPKMTASARTKFFDYLESKKPTPDEALVAWLSKTTTDPRDPFGFDGGSGEPKIYFPFDERRLEDADGNTFAAYRPKYAKDTHYVYFDARSYLEYDDQAGIKPYFKAVSSGEPTEAINATSFQILCAGLDGEFGAGVANKRKAFPFGGGATVPQNIQTEDMDNLTNFSDGKVLKELLP